MHILTSLILLTILFGCATHHKASDKEVKEYAAYQFNCPQKQLSITKLSDKEYKVEGCKESSHFKVMCGLGPCYIIKSE
jgi:hypothetical protein